MIGIYKITNKINGRVYIGQSKSIGTRWSSHLNRLECRKHENKELQNDYDVFGYSIFTFEILEECEENELLKLEKQYIVKYKDNYNISNSNKQKLNTTMKPKKINKEVYINADIYKQYYKNMGKLSQVLILLAYKKLDENNYIEISAVECANLFEITSDCIYRYRNKIVNDLIKSDIFEKVEYDNGVITLEFKDKYLQLNLKIPYDSHFYKNIINCNTVKFLIMLYLNKDVRIKVD